MAIKGLLYICILFVASVSLVSYKRGVYLIWLTLLLVPPIILLSGVKLKLSLMTILMAGSFISEMRYSVSRNNFVTFFRDNQKAILLYLLVSFSIVFLSQTVPIGYQLRRLFDEIVMLLFALQTYLLVKAKGEVSKTLMWIICGILLFNFVYCIYFEVLLGINPAGLPLYLLMGVDNSEFVVDMVESERGGLGFRAQTVYGHALSLGQYLLVMLPLFLNNGKVKMKPLYVFIICCLIVLSGSRGAMAPMVFVLLLGYKMPFRKLVPKLFVGIIGILILLGSFSDRTLGKLNKEVEPFIASLQFWDDKKQYENNIGGSSMEMRFNQFDAAQKEISANPILGRGYGYREHWQNKHNGPHPDLLGYESVLILYLVERGWLGLMFFFIITFYIYKLFCKETTNRTIVNLIFLGYILSIVMTGVRPFTFLFVCLSSSVVCGLFPKDDLWLSEESANKGVCMKHPLIE